METQKVQKAAKEAAAAAAKAKLTEKNKAAAREQLLRMQVYLARVSTK
jgi:hypothetical protein